jgi:predicted CoA-binding protein
MTGVEAARDASDRELADALASARTIAVVGIKAGAEDDAFRVPHYLAQQGYRIVPVNPKLDTVLGERVLASLSELREPVDVVVLFRATAHVPGHVDEILALSPRPRLVVMQLGVADEPSAERLRRAGIAVVQDRCVMVEHRRLLGRR